MRPLRVGHCIHGLGLGGAQQVVRHLVAHADPERLQPFVYSSLGGIRLQEVEEAGATVRVVGRHLPKFDPIWIGKLTKAIQSDGIDLVHTHLFGDSLHGFLAAKRSGSLPVIVTLHSVFTGENRLQQAGYRWLVPRCDQVVACSEVVKDSFAVAGVRGSAQIKTIHNGIEDPTTRFTPATSSLNLRQEFGIEEVAPVIASIGRLTEAKGLDHLIRAFSHLTDEGPLAPVLVILGDGPLRSELELLATSAGVEDRIRFTGIREDIESLLPQIDVVAFSSLWEGLPMALLEAMAFERPIIGTDIPGILEVVRPDREAIIVPVGDEVGLASALQRFLADETLRRSLGTAARQRFRQHFSAQRMADDYYRQYQALAGSVQSVD